MSDLDYRITTNQVAVSLTEHWRPMSTCPAGVKVQLLTSGGIAVYGVTRDAEMAAETYQGWAPLPYNRS